MNILAVVDDLLFTSKISGALEPAGHSVKVLSSPAAALIHTHTHRPDLVIVDLGVQGGDPIDMIRILKTELALPVLAFTRHTDLDGQQRASEWGCDRVVARSEFFLDINAIVGSMGI